MILIMSERDKPTVSPQEKNSTVSLWGLDSLAEPGHANLMKKDSMNKADGSLFGSTRKSLQASTSRREVMDSKDTTIVDAVVQNPTKNDITMKNNLGEEMKMNLDFGLMRSGPPSWDGNSEEDKKSETLHFNLKESNSG
ncbi:hypothetical protein BTUL_0032g00730 [Botrytis tulipae]|uniref:Uncharacterized protein n=1 Tax=Botrytis tulipae TaxID=87230 RepID=A0A4Z1EX67_9HELO|nr:hypothetical protein BTUL_0032g00730 [Botrytis tulipae]